MFFELPFVWGFMYTLLLFFAWTARSVYANLRDVDALHVQIVQGREKKFQKSRLHEALPKWEMKEYYDIFGFGQFDETSTQFQEQSKAVLQEKFKGPSALNLLNIGCPAYDFYDEN